jgi:predicted metal-dependent phosphoesterase TrpH
VARAKTFYVDLQVHTTRYSPCSTISPEQLIAAARSRRLDGIAITEHDRCWSPEEIEALKSAAGAPPFTVLAGCEIRTRRNDLPTGDLLAFGLSRPPRPPCSIDALCREVHARGGIVIAPHPFAGPLGIGDEVYSTKIDGLEVYNARHHGRSQVWLALQAMRQLGLAGVGASDAHRLEDVGRCCTEFDEPIATERDLIEAVLGRRCRPRATAPPGRVARWLAAWLRG